MPSLRAMAIVARPKSEEDKGSKRQIEAEDKFFEKVSEVLPPPLMEDLKQYRQKATAKERISEAMRMVSLYTGMGAVYHHFTRSN